MKIRNLKFTAVILLSVSVLMAGCNRNADAAAAADEAAENNGEGVNIDNTITISGTAENPRKIDFVPTPYEDPGTGTSDTEVTSEPAFSSGDGFSDKTDTAPQFFDVEDPIEPLMGYCDNDMCDKLIEQLNIQRTTFDVGTVTKNSSLCVAADVRAREYAIYPVYKVRPDGRSFTSVSPDGWVKNEYFIVPARNTITPVWDAQKGMWTGNNPPYKEYTYTPATVMEGLMEIREARNILLNEDYKQVGASWFVTGNYFIAGFTFSY